MKKTLLFVTLLCLARYTSGQQLWHSKSWVITTVAEDQRFVFDERSTSNDGYDYLSYNCKNGEFVSKAYYFYKEVNIAIKLIYKNEQLSDVVKKLGKLKKIGDTTWLSNSGKEKYCLEIDKDINLFSVIIRPILTKEEDPVGIFAQQ